MQILTESERRYDLDWLRVLAFGLLIFYHTGMIYVSWGFHIKSQETSNFLEIIMLAMNRWRLSLLFLISGSGVYFALIRRTNGAFAMERVKRLFFPLLFGMLVIVPPQIYFEKLQQGATFSYLDFYPSVFEFVPYPQGSFSWHHLWFIAYILVYSLLSIPIFNYFRSEKGKKNIEKLAKFMGAKPIRVYLFLIGGFTISLILQPYFPTTHNLTSDWANLIGSWYAFLLGYLFASNPKFTEIFEKQRFTSLFWAVLCYTLLIFFRETGILKLYFDDGIRGFIYRIIDNGLGGCAIFAILGFAKKHLNFNSPFLKEANKAVYPFYILHQTVIIWIGYYVLQTNMGIWQGLFLICVLTFIVCLCIYWFLIKPFALTCFLFGIKKSSN
ncbi:MAG: acyltransferase [Cytophagales bacterium]|nr:MAG: acyltransferase [Cytophagales bacterium]